MSRRKLLNKTRRNVACWLLLFCLPLLLSGCAAEIERPTLEDLGMVGVIGIDQLDGKKMRVTVSMPQPEQNAKDKTQTYSTNAQMLHQATMDLSTASERTLSLGQLRVVLFGEEYARETGLMASLVHLYRDATVGDKVFVAVVHGKAEDVIKAKYTAKSNISIFLNDLLRPRLATAFSPFTGIHDFIYAATDKVADPMVPYLEPQEHTVKVTKVALFHGDKMYTTMTQHEGKIARLLMDRRVVPDLRLHIVEDVNKPLVNLIISYIQGKCDVKSNGQLKNPVISIKVTLRGQIVEYGGNLDLSEADAVKKVEAAISDEVKKQMTTLIGRFQEEGIDPVGLGESIRSKYRGPWSEQEWKKQFQQAKISVNVRTEVVSTGTLR
ncbi:hypothetical protein CBW65_10930 [Tumebacillus avium]|uniref:Uncharacterized protein n=1 Tax=Tumebacillus avium TaxID=1903704 RepID=A0A1Y0ILR5_9BACL|nr:Ger(x)C family spore germination protein [Tumebacillus avium]ARU61462.1 hypothetical protein CBW65_10930 [Tumebacillus avium]